MPSLPRLPAMGPWLTNLRDLVFPPVCTLCGAGAEPGHALCAGCRRDLPWLGPACPRCAEPLPYPALCGRCLTKPPPYDHGLAIFHYRDPIARLLTGIKFRGRLLDAALLGELAADRLATEAERPELIVPVPLHRRGLRRRGYNQALELARPVAHRLGIPIDYRTCRKTRVNAPQFELPLDQRIRNVRGVYRADQPIAADHVVVFDDVMTTGATAGAVASALRAAGAARVDVWCLARAGRDPQAPRSTLRPHG